MSPTISIVTPVLNGRRFIAQTIESVLSQTGDFQLEYVVRDGGSTDGTLDVLRTYASHPNIQIVSEKDHSQYDAIQKAMAMCTGDIGCWINADDYYEMGAFQSVVEAFSRAPDCQWLYGNCDIVDSTGQEIRKAITWYKKVLGRRYWRPVLLCENFISQPATFWRMQLWRRVGGLSMKYRISADYQLWLSFADVAEPLRLDQTLAHFRRHEGSISETSFDRQFREELDAAAPYSNSLVRAIHWVSAWKTRLIYRVMTKI